MGLPFSFQINTSMAIDLEEINESPHLLDILIQMENILDSMDIYVFRNWLKGEIVEGPVVRRHWLDFTLQYQRDEMPDPQGAKRLMKHGVRVDYQKARRGEDGDDTPEEDVDPKDLLWLLRISIPRRLVVQIDAAEHDFYDDEVNVDHIEDAKDDGVDEETAFDTEQQDEISGKEPQ